MKEIKLEQLRENYRRSGSGMNFKEYVKTESENDPRFFSWFFEEDLAEDFDNSLSNEQREEFNDFVNSL